MQYDPIKRSLGKVFNINPYLRALFYSLLDLLLLRSWHIRRELRVWRQEAPANAGVLDAGSGFGQYVWRLAKMGQLFRITGIDVKEEQVADCNQYFERMGMGRRVQFRCENLETFNETERYDLVLSVDVMEHIEEDEKVMSNLYRSLKPGGTLLISTPSDQGGSDVHHHDHHSGATGFIDEHVRDGYNIDEISDKLVRAGFTSVEARYSYGKSGSLAWKLTMKFPILALNATRLLFILLPVYYLIIYPIAWILNHIDVRSHHKTGTGLIVKAIK
jgi:SAM-dependent methyltransferase